MAISGLKNSGLNAAYKELLGRDIGSAGLEYWGGKLDAGWTMDDIRKGIMNSTEYKNLNSPNMVAPKTLSGSAGANNISDDLIRRHVTGLREKGLTGAQLESQIYQDAKKYGVTESQYAKAMGKNPSQINQWMMENNKDPLSQMNPAASLEYAKRGTINAMGYKPKNAVASQATAQGYTPETIAQQDMSAYMNPYTQQVIDQSMADLERQRQMQTNNLGFAAGKAGAFGGSRHGVAEALTNEGFARQGAQMAAGLRQQGYGQALQSAGQDVGFMNQAGQFGAGAQNAASLANAQMGTQVSLANQNAGLQAAQLNMNAANQLGNLGNLGFTQQRTINQDMFNQGLAQQQMNQNLINSAMQQYQNWQSFPSNSLGYLGTALGGMTTPTSTTTSPNYSMGGGR